MGLRATRGRLLGLTEQLAQGAEPGAAQHKHVWAIAHGGFLQWRDFKPSGIRPLADCSRACSSSFAWSIDRRGCDLLFYFSMSLDLLFRCFAFLPAVFCENIVSMLRVVGFFI